MDRVGAVGVCAQNVQARVAYACVTSCHVSACAQVCVLVLAGICTDGCSVAHLHTQAKGLSENHATHLSSMRCSPAAHLVGCACGFAQHHALRRPRWIFRDAIEPPNNSGARHSSRGSPLALIRQHPTAGPALRHVARLQRLLGSPAAMHGCTHVGRSGRRMCRRCWGQGAVQALPADGPGMRQACCKEKQKCMQILRCLCSVHFRGSGCTEACVDALLAAWLEGETRCWYVFYMR